ncbi:MAG TPA: FecR domain-containing protein [Alphaproteobacteria bacterium]|nr:FecR domain-containing protein [Alphaproteobacteria bacterium]
MRPYGTVMAFALAACAAAAVSVAGAALGRADDAPIGSVAAMSPTALGTRPSGVAEPLSAGASIFFQERLATEELGRLHIRLADQSVLDVAPSSELTIDKFVYDPSTGAGAIAGSVGQGVLRYVGGVVSKHQDVVFTTPSATVAIRGSSMLVEVTRDGQTRATFLGGARMRVTSGGETREVTRAGYFVSVPRRGALPSAAQRARKVDIQRAIDAVRQRPGEQRAAALTRPKHPQAPGKGAPAKGPKAKPPGKAPPSERERRPGGQEPPQP